MTLFAPGRGDFLVFRSGYYNFVNKNHIESKANSKKIGACGEQNMFCQRFVMLSDVNNYVNPILIVRANCCRPSLNYIDILFAQFPKHHLRKSQNCRYNFMLCWESASQQSCKSEHGTPAATFPQFSKVCKFSKNDLIS